MIRAESRRALSTLVLDLLGERELMLAHRRVQVVDVIAFAKHATQPEVARDEAQGDERHERHEEPARELQRRRGRRS